MKTIGDLQAIKLRSLDRNLNLAKEKLTAKNSYVFLSATIAMPTAIHAALKPWERFEARVLAAGLATRKSVLSGLAAAAALGIPFLTPRSTRRQTYQGRRITFPTTIELTLPGKTSPSSKKRWSPFYKYLYGDLPTKDITISNNLRTTTIERTYVDIFRLYGPREALAFIEAAMEKHRIRKDQMIQRVKALGNIKGAQWAIALLGRAHNNIQSIYETLARYQLEQAAPPEIVSIVPQAELREGGYAYYPDLLINGFLIVEVDGETKYQTNTIETLLQERRRERELQRQGYTIIRFSPMEVEDAIVPIVRTTLQRVIQRVRLTA